MKSCSSLLICWVTKPLLPCPGEVSRMIRPYFLVCKITSWLKVLGLGRVHLAHSAP